MELPVRSFSCMRHIPEYTLEEGGRLVGSVGHQSYSLGVVERKKSADRHFLHRKWNVPSNSLFEHTFFLSVSLCWKSCSVLAGLCRLGSNSCVTRICRVPWGPFFFLIRIKDVRRYVRLSAQSYTYDAWGWGWQSDRGHETCSVDC